MRVLIAGCGYVGSALALDLLREHHGSEGHEVYGLRRHTSALPAGVQPIAADLRDPETLTSLPAVDALVYCAAADGRTEESYRAAYVDGLRNVLDALDGTRLKRALFTSSTAVYHQDQGERVDELSTTAPTSFSGQLVLAGEALLRERLGERGIALRLAGIYGPGRTRLVRSVDEGSATPPPAARLSNRIHRDDCAGALHHLLRLEDVAPIYLGVDDDPAPLADVMEFIAKTLGRPWPPTPTDASPSAGAGALPTGLSRRTRGNNKRCVNEGLHQSGYTFRVPSYRDGYPAICAEYLANLP